MADQDSRAGVRYTNPEIVAFVESVHVADTGAFADAFAAPQVEGMPAIQVAPSEARLLGLLLRLVRARRVVEVGTLAGYSALHLARGLAPDGRLWSLEVAAKHAAVARRMLAAAGFGERVEVRVGDARELLPALAPQGPFDAVFLDADKESYPEYGAWAAHNVRAGGLLVADNVYYFGRLMDDSPGARAMRRFHEQSATAFETTCVPTPDGLLIGVRR